MFRLLPLAAVIGFAASVQSADPSAAPAPPKTLATTPGKLLLSDTLATGLGKEWKSAKGKWEATDGATRGAELKADMHGAVTRRNLDMKDAVISYSFKLDGTKQTTLSLNGAKGHIGRAVVRPTGISVQKDDQDGKTGDDKPAPLDTVAVDVAPGVWHTLVVELRGPEIVATLDGTHTAFGSHPALDKPKANLGLTVAGESAAFKNLAVWEAAPSKEWEATRAKLQAGRKK